jgi:DNA repair exonuclease SbcCD ATPase subunit
MIESILTDVLPRLESLHEDAMKEIAEAQKTASANTARYDQAAGELGFAEAEISRLSAEREALPDQAYRAGMEEDYSLEDELKERYKELKPALEALEEQATELREEMRSLNPGGSDYPSACTAHQLGDAARVAYTARTDLELLQARLTKALDEMRDPVASKHHTLRATVQQLGHDRAWAESPVGRGVLR